MSQEKKNERTCRSCGETKAVELFERDSRYEGGRSTRCRSCKSGDPRQRFYNINRKAEAAGIPLELKYKDFELMFTLSESRCFYCGITQEESGSTHHIDHIIPKSKGGSHNEPNIVMACEKCNRTKGSRAVLDFYDRCEEFTAERLARVIYYVAAHSNRTMDEVYEEWLDQKEEYGKCEA